MPTDFLHGLSFHSHQYFKHGHWLDEYSLEEKSKTDENKLVITSKSLFLFGQELENPRYDESTNSLTFGSPSSKNGRLWFSSDKRSYVGTISEGVHSETNLVRGSRLGETYQTERSAQGKNEYSAWEDLYIGTNWVTDPVSGQQTLVYEVTLGENDISDRVAVTHTSSNWETTFTMGVGTNPFDPDNSTFEIVITLNPNNMTSTFKGTYTDSDQNVFDWKGSLKDNVPNPHLMAACPRRAILLNAAPKENLVTLSDATLSVLDLLNVSTLVALPGETGSDGSQKYKDRAQEQTGMYFQNMLLASLQPSDGHDWLAELFGPSPQMPERVKSIMNRKENFTFLSGKPSIVNMGQLLRDTVKDDKHKEIIKKIDGDKLEAAWKAMGESKEYGAITSDLYIEGYRDGVPGIQPYLNDTSSNWGQLLYNYVTSDVFLNIWRVQIASNAFKNVRETMYEIHTKLALLNPADSPLPETALGTMMSELLNAQYSKSKWVEEMTPFLEKAIEELKNGNVKFGQQILDQNMKEMQEIMKKMVSVTDTETELLGIFSDLMTLYANKNVPAVQTDFTEVLDRLSDAARPKWQRLVSEYGNKLFNVLKVAAYGAVAGFLLYQVIGSGGTDVAADIQLTLIATGFFVKGLETLIQSMMSTRLGNWIATKVSAVTGVLGDVLKGFGKWFTKEGVVADSIFVKILGKNSAEFFGKRLGPVIAVFAVVMSAIDLSKAIKTGDIPDIIFESLNLTVAVLDLVFIGLDLMGFAWAGPVGIAIAVIGVIIAVVQLIWNLIHPPTPPPDPIELFVTGPLTKNNLTV